MHRRPLPTGSPLVVIGRPFGPALHLRSRGIDAISEAAYSTTEIRQSLWPKQYQMLCLYLDFDGVLHPEDVWMHPKYGPYVRLPHGHRLFEHNALLEDVLSPYPKVKIVLSTSWVRVKSFSYARKQLSWSLGQRVIGATFHSYHMNASHFAEVPRGMQVWGDVCRRKPTDWLALDDDDLHWPTQCRDKYIRTHEIRGISDPDVLALLKSKLAAMVQRAELVGDEPK